MLINTSTMITSPKTHLYSKGSEQKLCTSLRPSNGRSLNLKDGETTSSLQIGSKDSGGQSGLHT